MSTLAIADMDGNAVVAIADGSALNVATFVGDAVSPTLVAFSLDMDAATVTLTFSETMKSSSLDVTQIQLQDASDASSSSNTYALTAASSSSSSNGVEIVITLADVDLNGIKSLSDLASADADTFLSLSATTITDMADNAVVAVPVNSGTAVAVYTFDTTAPTLDSFDLDLTTETLTMTFSEVVRIATFQPTGLTLQGEATAPSTEHTLTGGTVTTTGVASLIVTVQLTTADLSTIKSNDGLATSSANTYLRAIPTTVADMAGNAVTEITSSAALGVTTFTEDTTALSLVSFDLNMNTGVLAMTFSEVARASSLDVTGLTLQPAATAIAADAYSLTGGTVSTTDSEVVTVTLTATDLNAIKARTNLATASTDSYLLIAAAAIADMNGQTIAAVTDATQVTIFTADTTSPQLVAFTLDLTAEELVLAYTETILASSVAVV